jgi:hypothetical protein
MARSKLTTKAAIEQVLTGKTEPMTVAEITEAGLPLTGLKGKTPKQVFYSVLIRRTGRPTGWSPRSGRAGRSSSTRNGARR